jgi:hypothetical protein
MLKVVRDKIFEEPKFEIIPTYEKQNIHTMKQLLHCYHVAEEEDQTYDNPSNIHISEVEGKMEIEGSKIDS